MKKCTLGILAHVDAGKTTLSEAMLYTAGAIDRLGRVDKRDAHLDTESVERERGITVFSKQMTFAYGDTEFTLLDTPGHVDFSPETERTLATLDAAVLVVSAPDGVRSHTKTLWHLLSAHNVPTFLFFNKTDISEQNADELLSEAKALLSTRAVNMTEGDEEKIASADEALIGEFLDTGSVMETSLQSAIAARRLFPCYFGSALRMKGVKELLSALDRLTLPTPYQEKLFGAKVYKIGRDKNGARLSYVKITGGKLSPKDRLTYTAKDGEVVTETVEAIRQPTPTKEKTLAKATPGDVVILPGLTKTYAGLGIGIEPDDTPTVAPVLDYRLIFPPDVNPYETYMKLLSLAEEDPSLGLSYDERTKDVRVKLMGEIQKEILARLIRDRFSLDVTFGEGTVLYKETIAAPMRGAGHFEPLRHYAEVHLLLEPLPEGSGMTFESDCPTDLLPAHFQRLILSHLEERRHRGVLTNSPLCDLRVTLLAGKAHLKHTEGGDFRQATFRALRQGLRKAESVLLEPTFDFTIELPEEALGHAMTDVTAMAGVCEAPEFENGTAILRGYAPVSEMQSYATTLRAYTRGEGRITLSVGRYIPCHNADEVIAAIGYDPDVDERNTANSVFCENGAGTVVLWQDADARMHLRLDEEREEDAETPTPVSRKAPLSYRGTLEEDKELMRIFEATYGKIKKRTAPEKVVNEAPEEKRKRQKTVRPGAELLLVDGYNLLYAFDELTMRAKGDFDTARELLIRALCNYAHFRRIRLFVIFDAYKRAGGEGSEEQIGAVRVIYTKENETADAAIERMAHDLAGDHTVRVVTSDEQVQRMILGDGALRVSAREFIGEMKKTVAEIDDLLYGKM